MAADDRLVVEVDDFDSVGLGNDDDDAPGVLMVPEMVMLEMLDD